MLVAQSCPTLCDPMGCSLPGSSIHGILQARILEWVAFPFSRGSSQAKDWTQVSWIAGRSFTVWATREAPHLINEERILKFHHRHLQPLINHQIQTVGGTDCRCHPKAVGRVLPDGGIRHLWGVFCQKLNLNLVTPLLNTDSLEASSTLNVARPNGNVL